jgi:hypothetical protein
MTIARSVRLQEFRELTPYPTWRESCRASGPGAEWHFKMNTILFIAIAFCVVVAIIEIGIGLFKFLAGLVLSLVGLSLWALAGFMEIICRLWRTANCK